MAVWILSMIYIYIHFYTSKVVQTDHENMANVSMFNSISSKIPRRNDDTTIVLSDTIQELLVPVILALGTTACKKWLPYFDYFIESNLELEVLQKEDIFERLPKQVLEAYSLKHFVTRWANLLSCRESVIQNLEPQQKALCDNGPTRGYIHSSKLMKIPTSVPGPLSFDSFLQSFDDFRSIFEYKPILLIQTRGCSHHPNSFDVQILCRQRVVRTIGQMQLLDLV